MEFSFCGIIVMAEDLFINGFGYYHFLCLYIAELDEFNKFKLRKQYLCFCSSEIWMSTIHEQITEFLYCNILYCPS